MIHVHVRPEQVPTLGGTPSTVAFAVDAYDARGRWVACGRPSPHGAGQFQKRPRRTGSHGSYAWAVVVPWLDEKRRATTPADDRVLHRSATMGSWCAEAVGRLVMEVVA